MGRPPSGAGHPAAVTLDVAVEIAAASVLLKEGVERVEERHARECNPKPQRPFAAATTVVSVSFRFPAMGAR